MTLSDTDHEESYRRFMLAMAEESTEEPCTGSLHPDRGTDEPASSTTDSTIDGAHHGHKAMTNADDH